MAIKDPRLADLQGRLAVPAREFKGQDPETGEEIPIKFGRLLLTDLSALDTKLGTNLFASMTEAAQKGSEGGGLPKDWSYDVQFQMLFHSLRKIEPEIKQDEAAVLISLLPAQEFWRAFSWAVFGTSESDVENLAQSKKK